MRRVLNVSLMTLLALALALPAAAGEQIEKDGVLHIMNAATPPGGNEVIELEEVWRHGGEDDEDFFGMISQCLVGEDGNIYLLDTRMSEIPVYSRDGERLTTLSREGDGPGETRTPSNLLFMPDGKLGIVQVFPGRVTTIATDGTPGDVITFSDPATGGFLQMFDCVSDGQRLIVTAEKINPQSQTEQDRTNFVTAFETDGTEVVEFYSNTYHWDFLNYTYDDLALNRVDFRKAAVGPDGRVYVVTRFDDYRIDVYRPDGSPDRVIEREYEHVKRSEVEYNRLKTVLETQLAPIPNAKIVVCEYNPDIAGLFFGYDGNLWVGNSGAGRDEPEGIMTTWDVFTPDGDFLKTVSARCPGKGRNDILIWTPEGDAVMVTGFQDAAMALQSQGALGEDDDGEAEPMEVVYYRAK